MILASMFHIGADDICVMVGVPAVLALIQGFLHGRRGAFLPSRSLNPFAVWLTLIACFVLANPGNWGDETPVIMLVILGPAVFFGVPASLLAYRASHAIASRPLRFPDAENVSGDDPRRAA